MLRTGWAFFKNIIYLLFLTLEIIMFGTNKIVGKAFFRHAKLDELLVTSRFFTLQGEGPFRGHPAYFIRLAKCNLACSFCDTYFDFGEYRDFGFLLQESEILINDFFHKRSLSTPAWALGEAKKMVLVITGGEPALQKNLSDFLKLAQPYFQSLQIESNGILLLPNLSENTCLVISPKCIEKDHKISGYFEPNKKILARADCLKFVLSSPEIQNTHTIAKSRRGRIGGQPKPINLYLLAP